MNFWGGMALSQRPDDEQCPKRARGLEHAANSTGRCKECGAPLYWRSKAKALGLGPGPTTDTTNVGPVEPSKGDLPTGDPLDVFTAKQRRTLDFLRAVRDRYR